MDKNKLNKCLEVYKKNNSCRFVRVPEMRKFLMDEFGCKIPVNTRKPELEQLFLDNLNPDSIERYMQVERFGVISSDIQEILGISKYKTSKLIKAEKFDVKYVYVTHSPGFELHIPLYDIPSVIAYMQEKR